MYTTNNSTIKLDFIPHSTKYTQKEDTVIFFATMLLECIKKVCYVITTEHTFFPSQGFFIRKLYNGAKILLSFYTDKHFSHFLLTIIPFSVMIFANSSFLAIHKHRRDFVYTIHHQYSTTADIHLNGTPTSRLHPNLYCYPL